MAKKQAGRPTSYRKEYCKQAEKLCALGATDIDLADFFGICEKTLNNWKKNHPEFLQSLKVSKDVFDSRVVKKLHERAVGYSHSEDKIFNNNGVPMVVPTTKHYPPDTTAAIFWLKNRKPDEWRDKIDHDVEFSGDINITLGGNVDD